MCAAVFLCGNIRKPVVRLYAATDEVSKNIRLFLYNGCAYFYHCGKPVVHYIQPFPPHPSRPAVAPPSPRRGRLVGTLLCIKQGNHLRGEGLIGFCSFIVILSGAKNLPQHFRRGRCPHRPTNRAQIRDGRKPPSDEGGGFLRSKKTKGERKYRSLLVLRKSYFPLCLAIA